MTNTSKTVLRISTAVALVTAALSTTVHAEYRCATPGLLTLGEKRACELAREDTPDALIHFIHSTKAIYPGLKIDDYVGKADTERWELSRQKTTFEPLAVANANSSAKGAGTLK